MRACSKDINKTKRIKTTNIIDTVSSKVQNNSQTRKSKQGATCMVFASRPVEHPFTPGSCLTASEDVRQEPLQLSLISAEVEPW